MNDAYLVQPMTFHVNQATFNYDYLSKNREIYEIYFYFKCVRDVKTRTIKSK